MAINNAAVVFEPNAFIALDTARCFNPNIFANPRILKLFNYRRHDDMVSGKRLGLYPNTLFFDLKDETQMMMSEFCALEGPLPFWRATFFTALAALYQLGFKTVNLIGCTFDDANYAHAHPIGEDDKAVNENVMKETVELMSQLQPMLLDEGMEVRTCHLKSALDGICEHIPFHEALSECCMQTTSLEYVELKHSRHISK
jgi:hypothetical protein